MALFKLEEYESALECFSKFPENKESKTWSRKCKAEIDQEVVVASIPNAAPASTPAPAAPAPSPSPAPAAPTPMAAPSQAVDSQPQRPKLRQDWYQTQTHVVVNVFAKGAPDQEVHKEITAKSVRPLLTF